MANDQELRRLLIQYTGKTLPEVAQEVQKNEGSGGKSEKAKQVFAMLWYVLSPHPCPLHSSFLGFRRAVREVTTPFGGTGYSHDTQSAVAMSVSLL